MTIASIKDLCVCCNGPLTDNIALGGYSLLRCTVCGAAVLTERYFSIEHSPFPMLQSCLNHIFSEKNLLFEFIKKKGNIMTVYAEKLKGDFLSKPSVCFPLTRMS